MSDQNATSPPDGVVFDGQRFKVRVETLPQAIGGVARFEIVETPAAAAVVPVLAAGANGEPMVVLVRQARPAVGRQTLEIPAGIIERDATGAVQTETPEQTALRELSEETGYRVDGASLRLLTHLYPSPGITNELIHVYLASGLTPPAQPTGPADSSEIAGVLTVPLRAAVEMIGRGEIQDAKTIVGLLLARDALRGSQNASGQPPDAGGATMPVDPTSMPQGAVSNDPVGREETGGKSGSLTAENILTQEFGYANITAYQAQEDRARFFGLYLTLVGILAAALGAVAQFNKVNPQVLLPIGAFLLFLAGALGVIFFRMLIRLREAWFGSALAMNTIKEYYIEQLQAENPNLDRAFLWRLSTLPRADKARTPTFMVSYTTATISSLCNAGAVAILGVWLAGTGWVQDAAKLVGLSLDPSWVSDGIYALSVLLGALVFLIAMRRLTGFYRRELDPAKREQAIEQQEHALQGSAKR